MTGKDHSMPTDDVERLMLRLRRAGWNLGEVGTAGGLSIATSAFDVVIYLRRTS